MDTSWSQNFKYVSRLRACGPVIPGIPRFGWSGSGWVRAGSLWRPGPLW